MFHVDGATKEVRKVAAQFTSSSLAHFATTSWQQYSAIPYLSSPLYVYSEQGAGDGQGVSFYLSRFVLCSGPFRRTMFYAIVGIERGECSSLMHRLSLHT